MANRQIDFENLTMKEILIALRLLGGPVTRREICSDIQDNSLALSERKWIRLRYRKRLVININLLTIH